MEPEEVKNIIQAALPDCEVQVQGDGSHFEAIVVGDVFDGLSPVKKQQMVFATVTDQITSGAIHALSIKAYTPKEWETASKLRIS